MPDIIELLPDAVANQIAAGEVIQRPASVVKELLENAIDAGGNKIKVIIKDAGRTLIQIIDNGCGMSDTDARMSFERHATSKIKAAKDLFDLHTKGFRGEALASIAAIAHVELKTRLTGEELGTHLIMEGSVIQSQEMCSTSEGTSFAVKNLFYNVPARRNFLKSNQVEMRHIIDEFHRVSMTHPDVEFVLHHNDDELFNLQAGSTRQRIVALMGKNYNQRLVPLEQSTDIVELTGFVGKPEFARKTRGEQYFFVNDRFIKSTYLNHAVSNAYRNLMQGGHHPSYFIYMNIDPSFIDVNIHPTKTEIKFEDEKAIYAILMSSVKQSLGKYNITPTIDFEQETSFNIDAIDLKRPIKEPTITFDPNYNPFEAEKSTGGSSAQRSGSNGTGSHGSGAVIRPSKAWEESFAINTESDTIREENYATALSEIGDMHAEETAPEQQLISSDWEQDTETEKKVTVQLHHKYILSHIKSGLLVVDQYRAHVRIIFEQLVHAMAENKGLSQQQLFPQTVEFNAADYQLVQDLKPELNRLGFDLDDFGKNTLVVNGMPSDAGDANAKVLLDELLEQYKHSSDSLKLGASEKLAYALASSMAIKSGKALSEEEMNDLIDRLFACEVPLYSPSGKPVVVTYTLAELDKRFEK